MDLDNDDRPGLGGGAPGISGGFSLFGSVTSHMPPPSQGGGRPGFSIGDDDDDDDDGIDISSFTEKIASFSSLALRYAHTRDSKPSFADVDDSGDMVFDKGTNALDTAVYDLRINSGQSSVKDSNRLHSMPEKEHSPMKGSGGDKPFGLKRASTMPTSLSGMVQFNPPSLEGPQMGNVKEDTETNFNPFTSTRGGTRADPSAAAKSLTTDNMPQLSTSESSTPGLSRSTTVPGRLIDLPKGAEAVGPLAPQMGASPPKDHQGSPHRGGFLSHFFGVRSDRQVPVINEEVDGSVTGSISKQAEQFSAKKWGDGTQKARVRNRDINMWAPGGT